MDRRIHLVDRGTDLHSASARIEKMCKSDDDVSKKCEDSGNDTIKMDEEEDEEEDISLANVYRKV